jgi:hypothetical protein
LLSPYSRRLQPPEYRERERNYRMHHMCPKETSSLLHTTRKHLVYYVQIDGISPSHSSWQSHRRRRRGGG